MTLPLHMQMEIDISAAGHKQDIADGFAKLRAKLLPEPPPNDAYRVLQALMNSGVPSHYPPNAAATQAYTGNVYGGNPLQAANSIWNGAMGGLCGSYGRWPF